MNGSAGISRRPPWRRGLQPQSLVLALLPALLLPPPLAPPPAAAALLQLGGAPLRGGRLQGSGSVRLERAAGGETPVLTFRAAAGPVRLLLDTGATMTLLRPAAAARLGLRPSSQADLRLNLAGGGLDCGQLQPRRLRLPPLQLQGLSGREEGLRLQGAEALVLPVAALPDGVDGVLGVPSLRQLPLAIDPMAGQVRFGAAALASAGGPAPGRLLPLRWRQGLPILELQGPRGPVSALADTGAEGLFLAPELLALLTPLSAPEPVTLVGVCGDQAVSRLRTRGLGLGHLAPEPIAVIVTPNPIFRLLGVQAIVGQELLARRRQLWRLDLAAPYLELR